MTPKKRGPDQWAPVISRAMAESERQVLPFHSNPSSLTATLWVRPPHSRISLLPGFARVTRARLMSPSCARDRVRAASLRFVAALNPPPGPAPGSSRQHPGSKARGRPASGVSSDRAFATRHADPRRPWAPAPGVEQPPRSAPGAAAILSLSAVPRSWRRVCGREAGSIDPVRRRYEGRRAFGFRLNLPWRVPSVAHACPMRALSPPEARTVWMSGPGRRSKKPGSSPRKHSDALSRRQVQWFLDVF